MKDGCFGCVGVKEVRRKGLGSTKVCEDCAILSLRRWKSMKKKGFSWLTVRREGGDLRRWS